MVNMPIKQPMNGYSKHQYLLQFNSDTRDIIDITSYFMSEGNVFPLN